MRFRIVIWLCVGLTLPFHTAVAQPEKLTEALAKPFPVSPLGSTMEQAQAYAESRVALLDQPPNSPAAWQEYAENLRNRILTEIVFRGDAAQLWRDAECKVEWLDTIEGGEGYSIRKLRYEALPGMWIPALLYEPDNLIDRAPVILNVNGHDPEGKSVAYKQIRCINQAKRGMIALNIEWFGMGQLRTEGFHHARMNQLDLCGESGIAPFYLAMSRAIDILLSHKHADPNRLAVMGLSGGGWQTIFISSLDTRVKLCNPVAGYSSYRTRARHLSDLGDSEQTPNDLAGLADYTHLTAMLAPRPALLTYNKSDQCCFASDHALPPLIDAATPIYKLFGKESRLRTHINIDPGTHNFELDNRQAVYRMLGDFFYADTGLNWAEIPSDDEIKTAEELHVELPEGQSDFHSLAMEFARRLPKTSPTPKTKQAALDWQAEERNRLAKILRIDQQQEPQIEATMVDEESAERLQIRRWFLTLNNEWCVPIVDFERNGSNSTTILMADEGSASLADEVGQLLDAGNRVLTLDPYYFGQSRVAERDYLFSLLIAGVGERPLGVQTEQVIAVARWAASNFRRPITLGSVGPRTSLIATCAAALEPRIDGGVMLNGSMHSLKEIIENDMRADKTPELFCFGLLERFDMPQLLGLVAPRDIYLIGQDPKTQNLIEGLMPLEATLR